jgi:chromosome segregation ATPase
LQKQIVNFEAIRRNNAERKAEEDSEEVTHRFWTTNEQIAERRQAIVAAELAKPNAHLDRMQKELAALEATIAEHSKMYASLEAEMLQP